MAKKGLKFLSKIRDSDFCQKCDIFFGFSIVFLPNPGVQLKTDIFEQLAKYANDPHHFSENLFFDQFFHFL